jgi:hypothetical protein
MKWKLTLFNLLPTWLTSWKYADKLAHAIGGILIYLILWWLIGKDWALFSVFFIAIGIEIYDGEQPNNSGDVLDFLATIAIPITIYILT